MNSLFNKDDLADYGVIFDSENKKLFLNEKFEKEIKFLLQDNIQPFYKKNIFVYSSEYTLYTLMELKEDANEFIYGYFSLTEFDYSLNVFKKILEIILLDENLNLKNKAKFQKNKDMKKEQLKHTFIFEIVIPKYSQLKNSQEDLKRNLQLNYILVKLLDIFDYFYDVKSNSQMPSEEDLEILNLFNGYTSETVITNKAFLIKALHTPNNDIEKAKKLLGDFIIRDIDFYDLIASRLK